MATSLNVQVRTLFAPFDDTTGEYLRFVESAQKRIDISIFGFHLPALSDLLIAKHRAGIPVSLILDHSQERGKAERQEVERLIAAGVPLIIGTSPVHGQILHSKFTVVDEHSVEHGSWNYSLSASQQSNDMHFVLNAPEYVRAYLQHHDRILAFLKLHDMAMQEPGEATPTPALAAATAQQEGSAA